MDGLVRKLRDILMASLEQHQAALRTAIEYGDALKNTNDANTKIIADMNAQLDAMRAENAADDAKIAELLAQLASTDPANQAAIDALTLELNAAITRWRGDAIPTPVDPVPAPPAPDMPALDAAPDPSMS